MNEVSMRERGQRPVTWDELKIELFAVAAAIVVIPLDWEPPERARALANLREQTKGDSLFAQLLSQYLGPPPSGA